ncbi:1,4-dihydroxy-2-naphthoate octaprenyltransferase [Eudoraea sp.]|uniref:1,4-dihydroxy-2-naphthoate octaprenyltransferase n=1 Tax=Eudoraea sp. TaxID=1979955 RepID=UPI003C77E96B
MLKLKAWLGAARLRTLPLSLSGIIVGTTLAHIAGKEDSLIFILALFTTVALQVTSNFANDYGDGVKGTDGLDRIGPKRALQGGQLSRRELKNGIIVAVVSCLLLVLLLLYVAFKEQFVHFLIFFALGLLSIWASIKYTVGKNAYGYRGYGDVFVFLFFGLLSVLGTQFLFTQTIPFDSFLPAFTIGFLSTSVLNLNNLRDFASDKKAEKNTVIVKMGISKGKTYHYILLSSAIICWLLYLSRHFSSWENAISMIAFIPIIFHLKAVRGIEDPKYFDPELKKVALSTFLLAILFYFGYYNFL